METLKILLASKRTISLIADGLQVPRHIVKKSINWMRIDIILGLLIMLLFPFWGSFIHGVIFSPQTWGIMPWIWSLNGGGQHSVFWGKDIDPTLNEKILFGLCIVSALASKLFVLSLLKKRKWIETCRWINSHHMKNFREVIRC